MKKISILLAMGLLLGLLPGCGAGTQPPAVTTPQNTTPETTTPEQTTPEETTPAPTVPEKPKSFHLEIGEPVVLEQGAVGDNAWGHYQFPGLAYTLDGNIVATWNYTSDTIDDYVNTLRSKVSTDGGLTWSNDKSLCTTPDKFQMSNGKYFAGFKRANAHASTWQNEYTPATTWDNNSYKMFFAEDLPKNEDTTVWGYEYDLQTDTTAEFECTINWPHAPLVEFPGGKVYPMTQMFSLSQDGIITIDGVMYLPMYFHGFNSYAETRENALNSHNRYYSCYIFSSKDNGRTWDFLSQLTTFGRSLVFSEGLCEPCLNVMPDGSVMILMRSGGNGKPCYWARSTNNCESWSVIKKFDDVGVLPQMITLGCGVSIATYGRPYMRIRATSDPSGKTWQPAQTFDMYSGKEHSSCYYTDLLPLDETHALWIYSDFQYPNADGVPVKSIITRVITVVFDEE